MIGLWGCLQRGKSAVPLITISSYFTVRPNVQQFLHNKPMQSCNTSNTLSVTSWNKQPTKIWMLLGQSCLHEIHNVDESYRDDETWSIILQNSAQYKTQETNKQEGLSPENTSAVMDFSLCDFSQYQSGDLSYSYSEWLITSN